MSRVAVVSLTRDRLNFTKACFSRARQTAGIDYDHYVLDNGSTDGTQKFIFSNYRKSIDWAELHPDNIGIHNGLMRIREEISNGCYDYVLKMDNDCFPLSSNWLQSLIGLLEWLGPDKWVLSPRVEGLNHQPLRKEVIQVDDQVIVGVTDIVGGLCRLMSYENFMRLGQNTSLPLGYGDDTRLAQLAPQFGWRMGYAENIVVEHILSTNGQMKAEPEYFKRKHREEDDSGFQGQR